MKAILKQEKVQTASLFKRKCKLKSVDLKGKNLFQEVIARREKSMSMGKNFNQKISRHCKREVKNARKNWCKEVGYQGVLI